MRQLNQFFFYFFDFGLTCPADLVCSMGCGASLSASVPRLAELDLLGVSVLHLRTKFVETIEQSSPFKRHRCTDDGAAYCGGGLEKCSAGYKLIPGDNATVSEIEPRLLKPGRLSS